MFRMRVICQEYKRNKNNKFIIKLKILRYETNIEIENIMEIKLKKVKKI